MFQDQNNSLEEPMMAAKTELILEKLIKQGKYQAEESKAS